MDTVDLPRRAASPPRTLVKLLVSDRSPIVFRVVHGEARRKRSICSDDQPVLSGAAAPVFADTTHEAFHVLEAGNGIDHLPALPLFVDEPVQEIVDDRSCRGIQAQKAWIRK